MLNLLKGEFYKLLKSKAFYVCCLVAVVMVVFIYGMLFLADAIQRGDIENGSGGIYVTSSSQRDMDMNADAVPILEELTIPDMLQQMFGNFGSFITVIFAAIFVIGEYGNGVVKNIVGKGYARWQIFAAKYMATMAAAIIMLFSMVVFTVISGSIVQNIVGVPQEWDGAFIKELFCYSGIQFLLGAAVVSVVAALSEICRNLGAGIAIGFGVVAFSTLITGGLDILIRFVLPQSEFRISDYWLLDLIINCPLRDIGGKFAIHAVIVALVWIVLSAGAGVVHFRKADIK